MDAEASMCNPSIPRAEAEGRTRHAQKSMGQLAWSMQDMGTCRNAFKSWA